jgi:glutamate dehydrogenase
VNFAMTHYPSTDNNLMYRMFLCLRLNCFIDFSLKRPTLSYQRLQTVQPLTDSELYDKIRRTVPNKHELQVLESFLIFNKFVLFSFSHLMNNLSFSNLNRHVLKTNFYQPTKVALSFRLAPEFLPEIEYPKKPFGMFFVIGVPFFPTWIIRVC